VQKIGFVNQMFGNLVKMALTQVIDSDLVTR